MILMGAFREGRHCEPDSCEDQRKMHRFIVLLLCNHALSQPVTDESSTRRVRQLIECCPCPGSGNGDPEMLAGSGQLASVGSIDDCPCRSLNTDSEGSSSIFFPSTARADGAHMRPIDLKEDSKNLLKPEVALATSVLDTLREATEEEYQDALARDAARSAVESDAVPEESARNVVIVVNPRDSDNYEDFISEATHVQESRCIHPLESMSLGEMRSLSKPINVLSQTLKFPKLKRPVLSHSHSLNRDSDLGASKVEESIVDINGNSQKFQPHIPMFKFTNPLKNIQKNALGFEKPNSNINKLCENESSLPDGLQLPVMPILKSHTDLINNDLTLAPSSMQKQTELPDDKTGQFFRRAQLPLNLRNLLKLKDVELIPKTNRNKFFRKSKLDISNFSIPTLLKRNQNKNSFKDSSNKELKNISNLRNVQERKNSNINSEQKLNTPLNKINEELSKSIFDNCKNDPMESKEENLDALPSQSQVQQSVIQVDNVRKISSAESAEDVVKKNSDCNSQEQNQLVNTINSRLEESHDQSQELISVLIKPETVIVIAEKNNNEKNNQNLESSQDQILIANQDSEIDGSNTLVPLEIQEKAIDILPQSLENESLQEQVLNANEDSESLDISEKITDIKPEYQENRKEEIKLPCDQPNHNFHDVGVEITPENIEKSLNYKKITSHNKVNLPLSETLSNLRSNVVKQLENLKKPSIKSDSPRMSSHKDNHTVGKETEENIIDGDLNQHFNDEVNQRSRDIGDGNTVFSEEKETLSDISMHDLQDMSDKLLDSKSKNQQKSSKSFAKAECEIKSDVISNSNNLKNEINNESSGTKSDPINIEKGQTNDRSEKYVDACLTNFDTKNMQESETSVKSASQDTGLKEMDTEASDTVINTLPGILDSLNSKFHKPLFEDIVLPPPSDTLNLLGKPLGDVLNLNANMPTFDDLRERIANFFNTNDRSAEDYSSSLENGSTNDTPFEIMAPEASMKNSQRELPLLKQLGNFNGDIFHNKPSISTPFRSFSNTPRINLKTYRARVPVPNSLDLKPIKMDSLLGNKPGVNRQSLSLGSEKTSARNANSRNLLGDPLSNDIPTLEELSNNLRSNSRNLLSVPINPDLNLFTDNLLFTDVEDVAENIRLNTQKTMKGIKQKMKSTARKTKIQSPIGDPFAKPQELLDDMNDKLKAIHYDLNDRLSTIHENIIDSSKIKNFVDQPRKAVNRNVMTNLRRNKARPAPTRLQTAASTIIPQEIDPHMESNTRQREFTLGPEPRNYINSDWNKSHKTQITTESVLNSVKFDKSKSVNPSLPYLQKTPPLRQIPTMTQFLQERKPLSSLYEKREPINVENKKRPIFKTTSNLLDPQRQHNKVTISFGTTTARPFSAPGPVVKVPKISSSPSEGHSPNIFSTLNTKPLRTSAPVPSSFDEEFEDAGENFSDERIFLSNSNLKPSVLRETPNSDILKMRGDSNRFKSVNSFDDWQETDFSASKSSTKPSFDWANVKNSSNTRKWSNNSKLVKVPETEQSEMLRTPSDIVLQEPLKENVSYRCRMVCTKEIR